MLGVERRRCCVAVAADKRGVTGSQPQTLQCTICREGQKPKFIVRHLNDKKKPDHWRAG